MDVGGTFTKAVGKEKRDISPVLCRQGGADSRQLDDGQRVCLRDCGLIVFDVMVWVSGDEFTLNIGMAGPSLLEAIKRNKICGLQ